MKKINLFLLVLFVIDLLVLLTYGQAQEHQLTTYTYDKVLFYWLYFFPIAYLLGGYLVGQLMLFKAKLSLHKTVERVALILVTALLAVFFGMSILLTIHYFVPFLPGKLSAYLYYFILGIYSNYLAGFSVLGLILSMCISSRTATHKTLLPKYQLS